MRDRGRGALGAIAFAAVLGGWSAGAANEGPCRGVPCGDHGVCMVERDEPFCFCDEGYAAQELTCAPARPDDAVEARRRSVTVAGRIVYLASREAQRGPQWVGRGRADVHELREVVEPGQLWCSDFVAWVYREAGVPFTGGYDGGWHLTNNRAIRRWFERRGLWVDRDHPRWATFEPRAGDFVRFHTRSGNGHSGIVRYTTSADVLYTVEGNVGQRVRLRRWPSFRAQRRIDGFGILIDPERRARD